MALLQFTVIEKFVIQAGVPVTVLLWRDNQVSAAGLAAPTVLPRKQYADIVQSVNHEFQTLIKQGNPGLTAVPITDKIHFRHEVEADGRWHLHAKCGQGQLALTYDVYWNPADDTIRQERPKAFQVEYATYLLSIQQLTGFLNGIAHIAGTATL